MSQREFSKVAPAVWRSSRFAGLGGDAPQLLYLYFLTCEHQNSAGCFRLPDGYACADLGWPLEKYREARERLSAADLVTFDPGTDEIYVPRWLKHNPPMNDSHSKGTRRVIERIESDMIRETVEADFMAAESLRKSNVHPFEGPTSALVNSRLVSNGRSR